MRILLAVPHYYHYDENAPSSHGSQGPDWRRRVEALSASIASMHQAYGTTQCLIDLMRRVTRPTNTLTAADIHIVVCTTGDRHLVDRLPLDVGAFEHYATDADPRFLGYECRAVLRDRMGYYDYYGYLEDDIIARDPWMFLKLGWFTEQVGDDALLQPNRFEVAPGGVSYKAYIDGDIPAEYTDRFQDLNDRPTILSDILNVRVAFHRALNPHSGCYFLNALQMDLWASRPDFLARETAFVGPLESAATLGIMRTFRVYKPAEQNAGFLEIQHYGTDFIRNLKMKDDDLIV